MTGHGEGLEVRGVHKAFADHRVLRGVDLDVAPGSLTAVLGASGCGKTTLLRILAGFERPDDGRVAIGHAVVEDRGVHVPAEHRRIGYVPQEGSLFPHMTVEANVGFGLRRSERRHRAGELLEMVGLGAVARHYPHQLSGGQQQRVAVARALAVRPHTVLLDEPFASLDPQLRSSVRQDVLDIVREAGATTVLVTHDQDEALSLADTVAVLRAGTIAQAASPQELYLRPVDPDLARFVGDANVLEGTVNGSGVETPFGRLPVQPQGGFAPGAAPHQGPVKVLVRPEQIHVQGLEMPGPAGQVQGGPDARVQGADGQVQGPEEDDGIRGRVVSSGYHGHDAVVRVQPEVGDLGELVVRTLGDRQPVPGATVRLRVRGPVRVWSIDASPKKTPA
jgi:iron(III) transport system ATP-binding protein